MNKIKEFEVFFRENYSKAYYLALSITKDEEASRDIVADAFEYLYSHGATADDRRPEATMPPTRVGAPHEEPAPTALRSYLSVIVRNKCADHFRKQGVRERYADYVRGSSDQQAQAADYEEHERRLRVAAEVIETMTERTRQVVDLHYMQSKKYAEVASLLGISESAVKKQIMRALSILRERLGWGD